MAPLDSTARGGRSPGMSPETVPAVSPMGPPMIPPIDPVAIGVRTRRRWTLNGDFVTLAPAGVARYAREVTLALDALIAEGHPLARDLEIDIVVPGAGRAPLDLGAIPARVVPEPIRPRLPLVWAQTVLPRHVPGGLVSFCNLAPVAVRRQIACIHDLHTRLAPESYGKLFALAHRVILPAVGRRAAAITTVSEFSRDCLVAFGVAPAGKITVTYNGGDHARRWDPARGGLAAPRRPYVLCLGRGQGYKNLDLLLRLAPLLDARGLDLWMVGEVDPALIAARTSALRSSTPRTSTPGMPARGTSTRGTPALPAPTAPPDNLVLLGRVPDDDFAQALAGAVAFLFPSRIEGFGLPAVEAMTHGCPVIASTAPCLPEICGDAALYADPDDPGAWDREIGRLGDDPALRRALVAAGAARLRRYEWRRIAEQYLELMAQVDASG